MHSAQQMVNIFEFTCPSKYLKAVFEYSKKMSEDFSIRNFSKNIGLNSHTSLYQMIQGKRLISRKYCEKIITYFHLNQEQASYLELMLDLNKAKTEREKADIKKRMNQYANYGIHSMKLLDDFEIQRSPIYCFILERLDIAPIKYDIKEIKNSFHYPFEEESITKIIELMIKRKFIQISSENYLVKTVTDNFYSDQDKINIAVRQYHKELCKIAAHAVEDVPINNREFNAVSLNIAAEDIIAIKQYLRSTINELIIRFNKPEAIGAVTYQFNSQFFEITKANI